MARITTANTPIEGADLRQETMVQFPPAVPFKFDETGKFVNVPATGVTATPATLNIQNVGEFGQIQVKIAPADVSDQGRTFTSADETIATVDANGRVTAVKEGSTNVTVKTKSANKTATVNVIVGDAPVAVTGVTVAPKTASLSLAGTKTQQLTPTVAPANATNKAVTYQSSDATIASVSSTGLVTGLKEGTATITVKTTDGNKTDTCAVTVAA